MARGIAKKHPPGTDPWELRSLGRPSKTRKASRLTEEHKQLIQKSYATLKALGKPLNRIHAEALKIFWGCEMESDSEGGLTYFQPKGLPIPNLTQYRYELKKSIGLSKIQDNRYGEQRTRNRLTPTRGMFSEHCANLVDRTESDAFVVKERPIDVLRNVMPPLVVVRIRCNTSGQFVGIGCDLGGETQIAYNMALFTMAISKAELGRIIGYPISPEDWPGAGLSQNEIYDKGAGATLEHEAPSRELAPSHAGQGKATSETSHPKHDAREGVPDYAVSGLRPVALFKKYVGQTIEFNKVTDMSASLPPELSANIGFATPNNIHEYLSKRGRTSAITITFEQAVRRFLPRHTAKCTESGVEFLGQIFRSKALEKSDLLRRSKVHPESVEVYVLPLCLRYIWLDSGSSLVELAITFRFSTAEPEHFVFLADLEALDGKKKENRSKRSEHKAAAVIEEMTNFEISTGIPYPNSRIKPGREKSKTASALAQKGAIRSTYTP